MQPDHFQELTGSSKNALAWAFTRARQRSPSESVSSEAVSAMDLLVGVFIAHPDDSEPYQLFRHFDLPLEVLYDALRKQGGFAPHEAPGSPMPLEQMPLLDSEAEHILDASFMLSRQFSPETDHLVRLRDLFGGILQVPNKASALLQKFFTSEAVPSFDQLVTAYSEFLRYPSREKSFSDFLTERFPSPLQSKPKQPEISPAISFVVSGFSADTRADQDLIGIGAEVDAFAYLMAAKALQPPMAIGLFGDWGSGKSFFMEALRKRIHKITADAQESHQPQGRISIYKYIAQIEFNAWHYVEGELWASLVEHILRNLKTRKEDEPTLLQQRQQIVIDKLNDARRAQQADKSRKDELESKLSHAQARVTTLKEESEAALNELNDLKAIDILTAVKLSSKEKDDISRAFKDLGVTEAYKSVAELMHGADELRAVLQRGNVLITPLRERGWKWAAALIFVILIGPAISLVLSSIDEVPSVTNTLLSVSAFLSGLTVMLKHGTSWLSGALARAEGARRQLDTKRKEVETQHAGKIAEAERQYIDKVTELDRAKNEEREKEREIVALEQELQQVTPGRVLLDFINERVGSQDYRKHLGIAALIRSDFEQLSQLIAEQNEEFIKEDDGTTRKKNRHLINRIVLYIDDLDRCPPERVVQVLQAVHLLLAFPLFVVVVAVDARWLAQSLQKHYENLLASSSRRNGLELSEGFGRQASPQDYLEKIFQIPFWVRPLPEKARIRIIKGLVTKSLVPSSAPPVAGGGKSTEIGKSDIDETGGAKVELEQPEVHWDASERRRPLELEAKTDLTPEGLDILKIELQFMDELQSLLGQTPRSVKRFVNVYRLIKAVSLNQVVKFVEDKPDADFKLVLFLLAVLTGLPAISREFFRLLRTERSEIELARTPDHQQTVPTGRTLAQLLEALRGVVSSAPKSTPEEQVPATAATLGDRGDVRTNGQGCEDWYALRDLDRLETWLNTYDGGNWRLFDATAMADWAPQVVRFSYRIEEL